MEEMLAMKKMIDLVKDLLKYAEVDVANYSEQAKVIQCKYYQDLYKVEAEKSREQVSSLQKVLKVLEERY